MKGLAPVILRIGISLVFLWFGWQQLSDASAWAGLIPKWYLDLTGLSASILVLINGIFEIVLGTLLLLGIFTKVAAFLLMLHMLHITYTVGYNGIGVRDFGLSLATIAIWLHGRDTWCLERFFRRNKFL